MKFFGIFLVLSLAACATEYVPLTDAERAQIRQEVQDEFSAICLAQGEEPAPSSNTGCLARIASPALTARIKMEETRRYERAQTNRAVLRDVAGVLAGVGEGMSAYGTGYSAGASSYQPIYTPPVQLAPHSCQNFGGIVRCR